jgi:hypothetical protein
MSEHMAKIVPLYEKINDPINFECIRRFVSDDDMRILRAIGLTPNFWRKRCEQFSKDECELSDITYALSCTSGCRCAELRSCLATMMNFSLSFHQLGSWVINSRSGFDLAATATHDKLKFIGHWCMFHSGGPDHCSCFSTSFSCTSRNRRSGSVHKHSNARRYAIAA